jgi:hypothetical protein
MPARKLPRPFEMPWGRGLIVEEAAYAGEYHESVIQLMEYDAPPLAGEVTLRFCSYSPRGAFLRSPLMVSSRDLEGLRLALQSTPRLREVLRRLIE